MSDFIGIRIALSSLQAQRKAIDVTGQNIANVNTDGYSRQRVGMASDSGPMTPALHSRWNGTGLGVATTGVDRIRDQFLETRSHQEHSTLARHRNVQLALGRVEGAFAEPSDTGVATQLADFWAGWDDVANNPDDIAARSQLIERSTTLMAGFTAVDEALTSFSSSTVEQLTATAAEVNATAARVADLNKNIQTAVNAGMTPNDLIDQRDLLISGLASKVGATVRAGESGSVDVFLGGNALVRGMRTEPLEIQVTGQASPTDPTGSLRVAVVWAKDGSPAAVGGAAAGMAEVVNDVLPRYRGELRAVRDQVAAVVNDVHRGGVGLAGGPASGVDFFVASPDGRGYRVNADLVQDPGRIAASAVGTGPRDGSVAQRIAALAELAGGPDAGYRELVVRLGVESQSTNRRVDIQSVIAREVDNQREAVAGVSLDEEMTNLIALQHAYDAAARLMTTIDSMLDTLINRTGLVGR
jgi:flagellar hook-associated protein 1